MDRWKIVTEYLDVAGRCWTLMRVRDTADRATPAAELARSTVTQTVTRWPWPSQLPPVGTVDVQVRVRVYAATAIAVGVLAAEQTGGVRFLGNGPRALLAACAR